MIKKRIHFLSMMLPSLVMAGISNEAFGAEPVPSGATEAEKTEELEELVVTGQSAGQRLASLRLGAESLELSKLSLMPVLFGENDIIKSITYLPGVHSEGDGSGGFEVRGGTSSQNLIMLDGMTLYSPTHVMGIFSTFNDQAIGRATLYKGPIPASYGEASSSVLETSLAPGNLSRWQGEGTIGILAAKVMAGGPIVKDRLSVAVTARRSYVDMFLKMVPEYRDIVMNFYDITAKVRYRARPTDNIDLSFIASHDNMAIGGVMGMYWGNIAGSGHWTANRGDNWSFNTTGAFTSFNTKMTMSLMNSDQELTEYIRNASVNENVSYSIDDDRRLEFGVRSEFLRVQSADFTINGNRVRDVRGGWVNGAWINYEGLLGGNFFLS